VPVFIAPVGIPVRWKYQTGTLTLSARWRLRKYVTLFMKVDRFWTLKPPFKYYLCIFHIQINQLFCFWYIWID